MANGCFALKGNENIGFGKVSGGTIFGDGIRYSEKRIGGSGFALEVTVDINGLLFADSSPIHV